MNLPLLLRASLLPLGAVGAALAALYLVGLMVVMGLSSGDLSGLPRDGHTLTDSPPVALLLHVAGRYGDAALALPGLLLLAAVVAHARRGGSLALRPHSPTAPDWFFGTVFFLMLLGAGCLLVATMVVVKPWGLPEMCAVTCGVLGLGSLFAAGLLLELATWKQG